MRLGLKGKFAHFGRMIVAMTVLSICVGVAHAQSDPAAPPPPGPPGHRGGFGAGAMDGDPMGFVGFEAGLGGKTVTGAPFSATFSTQSTQVLADGNQIQRSTTGTLARDGQGRTRRDMTLSAIGPWSTSGQTPPHVVFINDNVAATQYILDPERKIAREMRRHGKHGGGPPNAQSGPPNETPGQNNRNSNNVVTVSLGTQTVNGVQAEGTRITRTIPAGTIGNANPIVLTTERWYSPDLHTVVMIKRSDPRMGETTYQLTNIQKQEPDASLFQVPSDYTVKQGGPGGPGGPRRFGRKSGRHPPPPPQN